MLRGLHRDSLDAPQVIRHPEVIITGRAWELMMAFVQRSPMEINGFGYVDVTPDGDFVIDEVFILKQTASMVNVVTDDSALGQHMCAMMNADMDTSRLCFQWHSHVKGDVYFSATDVNNINRWPGPKLISLVLNKAGECRCRVDFFTDRLALEQTPLVPSGVSEAALERATADIKALVTYRPAAQDRQTPFTEVKK